MRPKGIAKLKDVINRSLLTRLAIDIRQVFPEFKGVEFVNEVAMGLDGKSFFQRIIYAAEVLRKFFPDDFRQDVQILTLAAPEPTGTEGYGTENFHVLIMTRYIALFGIEHPEISLPALGILTRSYTAEFDVRPFIDRYPEYTIDFLKNLTRSDDYHERRFASEGSRPRLPLATHLKFLKQHPECSIEILSPLKQDPIRYVQRSVANHLADTLKDNPSIGHKVIDDWVKDENPITDRIILRALQKPIQDQEKWALSLADSLL